MVGGILVLLIAIAYAEIATMLPHSGAVVRYPQLTHGSFTGFLLGREPIRLPSPAGASRRPAPPRS